MPFDPLAFEQTLASSRRALLEARTAAGHWEGELSASPLSTATAVFALRIHCGEDPLVGAGFDWLVSHQNEDGGWGDTVKSLSNISTTALCWAALGASPHQDAVARAEAWLTRSAGGVDPNHLIPAIIARYGKDHTFSVPILTMCALAGRLGEGREAWRRVPQLPFELAAFPQRWFKWLRLPVVSYALPALIAIGLVRHRRRATRNPIARFIRCRATRRALQLLEKIQPASGGFLEATPLTSFVVMSLVGAGLADHPGGRGVVGRGIEFLRQSARPDGSWPIDTNLATWVTTLSVNALTGTDGIEQDDFPAAEREKVRDWLLGQQYRVEHPYTLADPGAWAWTDLSGGVPDADDTSGALMALHRLGSVDERTRQAAEAGVRWLLDLQNRDGGIPTFCRGWGKLPFDRSSADLTAHALRAWAVWSEHLSPGLRPLVVEARARALRYLVAAQRADGAWVPLWFGNQYAAADENPTYGTSRVLRAATDLDAASCPGWEQAVQRGAEWLIGAQNADGGWGGDRATPSTIEETALAVEALASLPKIEPCIQAIDRGVTSLIDHTRRGTHFDPSPIGFYFAKLWYFEKLYPLIFTVTALNAVRKRMGEVESSGVEDAAEPAPMDH